MNCLECEGTGLPTRKHSDLDSCCVDCRGTGKARLAEERIQEIREKSLPREYCPAIWLHELLDEIDILKEDIKVLRERLE